MDKDEPRTDKYIPCTDKYEVCTANVQTCIFKSKVIVLGIFNVYTHTYCFSIHVCVHTCLELVHTMYIPGTSIKYTKSYYFVHVQGKQKVACEGNRTKDLA